MINGVSEKEESIIKEILKDYPYSFYYYGSRVKGDYSKSSDLDILVENLEPIPVSVIEDIEKSFNESKIPYVVNISQKCNMEDYFYDLIKDSLVSVFS